VIELKTEFLYAKAWAIRNRGNAVAQDCLAAHAYQQALHEYQPPNIERRAAEILAEWLKGEK
jgi:hypothetical protein